MGSLRGRDSDLRDRLHGPRPEAVRERLSWCVYCGEPAVYGACWLHSDLPALDPQFHSLCSRLKRQKKPATIMV